jgi:hypothetical protein
MSPIAAIAAVSTDSLPKLIRMVQVLLGCSPGSRRWLPWLRLPDL